MEDIVDDKNENSIKILVSGSGRAYINPTDILRLCDSDPDDNQSNLIIKEYILSNEDEVKHSIMSENVADSLDITESNTIVIIDEMNGQIINNLLIDFIDKIPLENKDFKEINDTKYRRPRKNDKRYM